MFEQPQVFDSLVIYKKEGSSSRDRFDAENAEAALTIVSTRAEKVSELLGFGGVETIKLYNGQEEFVYINQDGNWQRQQNKQ